MSHNRSRCLIPILVIAALRLYAQGETLESRLVAIAGLKPGEVRDFLAVLQTRVAHRDAAKVCAMVDYPLRTRVPGRIQTPAACRRNYARIFNEKVVHAVSSQKFDTLFVNSNGVMIGRGEVWLSGICSDKTCTQYTLRIVTVNN